MRVACLIATAVFAYFTYLQTNDLDQYGTRLWVGWMLAYGAVALASVATLVRVLPAGLYLVGASIAAVAAVVRATAIDWNGPILYNEANPAGNESGGLIIVAAWLAALGVWALRRRRV